MPEMQAASRVDQLVDEAIRSATSSSATMLINERYGDGYVSYVQGLFDGGMITEPIRQSLLIRCANVVNALKEKAA